MRISNRKFAITGAARGLGAALAIEMARAGARPVLLARSQAALDTTARTIRDLTGQNADLIACDLADRESATRAGEALAHGHPDLDGIVHNGAMWLPGAMEAATDTDIAACIASAAIGALILTRHVLPILKARPGADIHTVVSTSGVPNRPLNVASVPFTAAKHAQAGFVTSLADELSATGIRVTAVYPGDFEEVAPSSPDWATPEPPDHTLSTREVVGAILFILNQPHQVAIRSLVIE